MDVSKYTEKAQEAISVAQKLAEERNNTQLETEHLLLALVDQKDGVVLQILDKLGVDHTQMKRQLENELEKLAKASGPAQVYLSLRLKQVLDAAEKESRNFKDEYVSTEHMLIAIIDQDTGAAGQILKGYGITRDRVYQILASIRGNQRVTQVLTYTDNDIYVDLFIIYPLT